MSLGLLWTQKAAACFQALSQYSAEQREESQLKLTADIGASGIAVEAGNSYRPMLHLKLQQRSMTSKVMLILCAELSSIPDTEALQQHHHPEHFISFTLSVIRVLMTVLYYFLVILMYKHILIYLES
jgi:hypothetical protein